MLMATDIIVNITFGVFMAMLAIVGIWQVTLVSRRKLQGGISER
jgi:uncharacterized membrane protein (DUF485 family)